MGVSVCCMMRKSVVAVMDWGFFWWQSVGWTSKSYMYFCVHRTQSVKDLGIEQTQKLFIDRLIDCLFKLLQY